MRRGLTAASLLALAGGGVQAGLAAAEDAPAKDFTNGTAAATATSYRLNPTAAGLSIGITFGISLSDYTNEVSRAESRAIDLGVIGTSLAAQQCDGSEGSVPEDQQPQALRVESSDPDGPKGVTEKEKTFPLITKSVKADPSPASQAETTSIPLGAPGVLTINGAHSKTVTHIIDGKTREAIGTADIGELDLGGQIVLKGLHWEALHRSGAESKSAGTFSIGSAVVGGKPVPMPDGDPTPAIDAVNKALAPFGIELRQPKAGVVLGTMNIDPLTVAVVPSPTRDGLVNPVGAGAQPVREASYDAILKAYCKFGTFSTVSDIVIGSITGGGSFNVELGGANAVSGEVETTNFLDQGSLGDVGAETLGDVGGGDLGGGGGDQGGSGGGGTADLGSGSSGSRSSGGSKQSAAAPRRGAGGGTGATLASTVGKRGGALAVVGAVGLGLLGLMAELDRRAIRRAQRAIPFED